MKSSHRIVGRAAARAWVAVVGSILLLAAPLAAQEVVLQNDSLLDGDEGCIIGDFVPGEQAAVWLTIPENGSIVAVQVLWWSIDPDAEFTIERNLWVRDGSSFPRPGADLLRLEAPKLIPFFMNEFRHVDEGGEIPIDVPVQAGDVIHVSLEYENPTDIRRGTPSIVRDIDGCRAGRNALYAPNLGGWIDWCSLPQTCGGRPGDFAIRAVLETGGGQRRTLAVDSDSPGALVQVNNDPRLRETPFELDDLQEGDDVRLTADRFSPQGRPFVHWKLDGRVETENRELTVPMNVGDDRRAEAIYNPRTPRVLHVESNVPQARVDAGDGFQATPFDVQGVFEGDTVRLRAFPFSPEGDPFKQWAVDGQVVGVDPIVDVPLDVGRDRTAQAVYQLGEECQQLVSFKARGKPGMAVNTVQTTLNDGKAAVDCVGDDGNHPKKGRIKSSGKATVKVKNLVPGVYVCTLTSLKDGAGVTVCEGELAVEQVQVP